MLPPVILGTLPQGVAAAKAAAVRHLALTHESRMLAQYAEVGAPGGAGPLSGRQQWGRAVLARWS